nr:hypothetical protein [Nonomuraea sediminis]
MLEVLPHPLLRIQLRRVRRQKVQLKLAVTFLDELLHLVGPVDPAVVRNEENGTVAIANQPLTEGNEVVSVQAIVEEIEAQLPALDYGRNHPYRAACPGALDHGGGRVWTDAS